MSSGWATPLCGQLLVDLGADVVRLVAEQHDVVEALGPDQAVIARHMLDAGKLVLDSDDVTRAQLESMASRADVVLGDLRALDRLEVASMVGSKTVLCTLSPFGSTGPLSHHVASDLTLQAVAAIMGTTGQPGGAPTKAGIEIGAAVTALYGCIGISAALIERLRSSLGQSIEVSAYDCLVSTLTQFASRVLGGVPALKRLGNQGANSAPWNLFKSRDGDYVFIIAGSDPTFERLTKTMGMPELLLDERFDTHIHRRENREEITAVVSSWAAERSAEEIVSGLRTAGVPVSLVATPAQVLADPHFRSRGLLGSGAQDGLTWQVPGTPLSVGRHWAETDLAPPFDLEEWLRDDSDSGALDVGLATSGERTPPLTGFTVLDVGTITAGPFCTRLLGNLGAEVIKVEPLGGELGRHSPPIIDGESVYFHITNNGKQSVCLDLATPDGQQQLLRLARSADALVENLAPGALVKRGLGPLDLTAVNPRLVYTSVSGFGHEGAHGGQRAYDTVVQAAAGVMAVTGEAGGEPLKTGISSADVMGALGGTAATLAALFGRERAPHESARGGWLDVAMYDVLAWSTQTWWPRVLLGQTAVVRVGNEHPVFTPYGAYAALDGMLALSCETQAEWKALAGLLADSDPSMATDWAEWDLEKRRAHRAEINEALSRHCATRPLADLVSSAQEAGVPAEPVLECADAVESAQTEARQLIATVARPGHAAIRVTNFPVKFSATPAGVTSPAPGVDEHGDQLRSASR